MIQKVDISKFDPNGAGLENAGIFGLPFDSDESSLVLIPVPWEATTSYGRGTSAGPRAILQASPQLDLFDHELGQLGMAQPWHYGISLDTEESTLVAANAEACRLAQPIIALGGELGGDSQLLDDLQRVNQLTQQMCDWVRERTLYWRSRGKLVGLVGGDHSTPLGMIEALSLEYPQMGVLQIDAHADLRVAYEGFVHSHASIIHNVLQRTHVSGVVQVGIRDFSQFEFEAARQHPKVQTFYDADLKDRLCRGETWDALCRDIVSHLPEQVYVTFDIDGLDPSLCPHTGTPVAGGFRLHEAIYLLKTLVRMGKRIVGFDLNEVAPGPDEWDGNVGARLLYKLCGLSLLSVVASSEKC